MQPVDWVPRVFSCGLGKFLQALVSALPNPEARRKVGDGGVDNLRRFKFRTRFQEWTRQTNFQYSIFTEGNREYTESYGRYGGHPLQLEDLVTNRAAIPWSTLLYRHVVGKLAMRAVEIGPARQRHLFPNVSRCRNGWENGRRGEFSSLECSRKVFLIA